jgi:hypothetical protein
MKATCVSFICPSCNLNVEIFLKKNAKLIALSCPSCKNIITVYKGTVIVNNNLKDKLKKLKSKSDVVDLFCDLNKLLKQEPIKQEDVLDFKIDLNLCNSFDEVLKLVCQA